MSTHRKPSELAVVAARSAVTGASTVRFDVTHLVPGAVAPASEPPAVPGRTPVRAGGIRDVLAFEAAGLGVRMRTWTPRLPEEAPQDVAVTGVRSVRAPTDGDLTGDLADTAGHVCDGHEFAGHTAVNPSFLYEQNRTTELLLTLSGGPWRPDLADCRMLGLTLEALTAAVAQDGQAPILLLQCPASPYRDASPSYRKDGSGEEPRRARALAVRMAFGLDDNRPADRIAVLRRVTAFAEAAGIGLQISDSRLGRAPGEWWTVLPPKSSRYRRYKAAHAGAPDGLPTEVRMVTFVGPARVGSSAAIFADLAGRGVGVLAVTSAALQEIAFVHALLPVAPARAGRRPAPVPTWHPEIEHGLGQLASECGLAPRRRVAEHRTADLTTARDYTVLETGPVRLSRETDTPEEDEIAHPLWVSWNLPADPGGPEPLAIVLEQAGKVSGLASVRVDFARVRRVPTGRSRGRAKLSVVLDGRSAPEAVPVRLGTVCAQVQTASVTQCGSLGVDVGDLDLRVAWRERWLGTR